MMRWLAFHVGIALMLGVLSAVLRGKGFSARKGLLDFCTALLLPVVGPAMVVTGLVFEKIFSLTVRPAKADSLLEDAGPPGVSAAPDPIEEMQIGLSAAPFEEILIAGEPEGIDLALQRLARNPTNAAIRCLKKVLRSPVRERRVRARALLVRVEDRLLKLLATSNDPEERGRAYHTLARLSLDPGTAREHLTRAAGEFTRAVQRAPHSPAAVELARIHLERGEYAVARTALARYLAAHPHDAAAHVARMDASFKLGEIETVRKDLRWLATLDARYGDLARKWSPQSSVPSFAPFGGASEGKPGPQPGRPPSLPGGNRRSAS